ncbi:hypothetical protein [Tepidiforma sp.]|uniref:hypothetical protein n=1 Tax=Tepidiforma sp. TaxID=2682230 RepID=UPI00258ACA23|nr:hypothetical protein [Tepidiforma sp.]
MNRLLRVPLLLLPALAALAVAAACIDDDGSTGSRPNDGYPTKVVDAPIDAIDIVVRESMPPQYAVVITSGLPNGCARFAGWEIVARTEAEIVIRVTNRVPDSDEVACTMVYGTHDVDGGAGFRLRERPGVHRGGERRAEDVYGAVADFAAAPRDMRCRRSLRQLAGERRLRDRCVARRGGAR